MSKIKKVLSILLICIMLTATVHFTVSAVSIGKVNVIIRNDTYSVDSGALWDGVLIDDWIDIDDNSTALSVVMDAVNKYSFTQKGIESGIIDEINGISTGDNGYMSGWMGTLNDWFTNQSLNSYTVENGMLKSGDEVCIMYTSNWGEDIGSSWYNNYTTLDDLDINAGNLSPDFDLSVNDYTLYIKTPTQDINVIPTATNKNFQVRTYKNEYTPDLENSEYRKNDKITVTDGDVLYIGVGDPAWQSMGYSQQANIYTVKIINQNKSVFDKISSVSDYFLSLDIPTVTSVGGEWTVTGLARNNSISNAFSEGYYENAVSYIKNNGSAKIDKNKSSDNSRMIIALTSIGKDVTDIAGYNLLEPLADFNYVKKQGINGPVWALIAFDTLRYDIPQNNNGNEQTTREKLKKYILEKQLETGGWDSKNIADDADTTSMAIQALAPYYNSDIYIKSAIDKGLDALSKMQNDNGGFSSSGSINCESCAQAVVAMTSMGIDPSQDSRFIKNGKSALDALMSFCVENGFSHTGDSFDRMATEQAYYSLVSYARLLNDETSLYNMMDVLSPTLLIGDVNNDGVINVIDATEIQKYISELKKFNYRQLYIADFNKDGIVSVIDATEIQAFIVL